MVLSTVLKLKQTNKEINVLVDEKKKEEKKLIKATIAQLTEQLSNLQVKTDVTEQDTVTLN